MSVYPARRGEIVVTAANMKCLRVLARMEICREMSEGLVVLYEKLDRAVVVDPRAIARSVVTIHSRVLCFDHEADAQRDVTLVYPWNEAPYAGRVSVVSPLGTALLGASIGTMVRYLATPDRLARVDVLDVLYQPEAAGHV